MKRGSRGKKRSQPSAGSGVPVRGGLAARIASKTKKRKDDALKRASEQHDYIGEQYMDATKRYAHYPLPLYIAQSVLPSMGPCPIIVCGSDKERAPTRLVYVTRNLLQTLPPGGLPLGQRVDVTCYAWTHVQLQNETRSTLKLFVWDWEVIDHLK